MSAGTGARLGDQDGLCSHCGLKGASGPAWTSPTAPASPCCSPKAGVTPGGPAGASGVTPVMLEVHVTLEKKSKAGGDGCSCPVTRGRLCQRGGGPRSCRVHRGPVPPATAESTQIRGDPGKSVICVSLGQWPHPLLGPAGAWHIPRGCKCHHWTLWESLRRWWVID